MTGRYLIYSIIYIAVIAIIVFSVSNENFTITLFKRDFTLPIFAWFALPLAIFALLSILHMMFYGVKHFLDARAVKSDLEQHDNFAKEIFLGLDSNKEFKTPMFESSLACLKALNPWQKDSKEISFKNESLQNAYNAFCAVKNGEIIETKQFRVPKNTPLYIQNEINKVKTDIKSAIAALTSKDDINTLIKDEARKNVILNANYAQLSKCALRYDFDDVKTLISRHAEQNLELGGNELFGILNSGDFSAREYLECAKILKKKISPDSLINIFKELKNSHPHATEAYFYLLYDLQMIDELRTALGSCEGERFERIEALLFLRDHGKIEKADFIYNL